METQVLIIRPFDIADYAAIAQLRNASYPNFAKDAEELRLRDEMYPSHCRFARWVAVDADRGVIGFAEYHQNPWTYDPRKFRLEMAVEPEYYGKGVRSRLYETVIDGIEQLDPVTLESWSREDMPWLISFLEQHEFAASGDTLFTSSIDLTSFNAAEWEARVRDLQAQPLRIRTLAELGAFDRSVRSAIYDFWAEVSQDLPLPADVQRTVLSSDEYWKWTAGPSFFPQGYFVALDGAECVATSQLFRSPIQGELRTGLTAIRRAYRRQGIAFGLKVMALEFARSQGYRRVITDNAGVNEGMLAINVALGFVRDPAWVRYVKKFVS